MPSRLYLPRGMMGRIDCLAEANPPLTLIVWFKGGQPIDYLRMKHVRVNKDGTLIIKPVIISDEGQYTCTPYSPLGPGKSSSPVQVFVRGKKKSNFFKRYIFKDYTQDRCPPSRCSPI